MADNCDADRHEWEGLCAALNTVRIHEMGEEWHRQCRQEALRRAARRWHISCDEPQIILGQLEDKLVELSLRLHRSSKTAGQEEEA